MKSFKKHLAIFAVLLIVLSLSCFAVNEVITIESLTFDEYTDEDGNVNEDLMSAEISFSSEVDAEQFSIILMSENLTQFNDSNASKIIYIDQFACTEDGMYKFPVEKSRIASAINSDDIDSTVLYVKMGGMGIDEATLMTVIYEDSADDIVYGDATGDGEVTVTDSIFILRVLASNTTVLTEKQKTVMDVNGDGDVTVSDVIKMLQYIASGSGSLDPTK